jgi:hypothetical protein
MRLLDLFCGRWGWSRGFAVRGWECVGIDKVEPVSKPDNCTFLQWDILFLTAASILDYKPDFVVASTPCEEFSVHGMKNFHPEPKYPEMGILLFNHARSICEESGVPYLMENVRAAQQFVGPAVSHTGSFYLWGNSVPPLLPKGLLKGFTRAGGRYRVHERRSITPAEAATIPPELANCVADYAERLLSVEARQ